MIKTTILLIAIVGQIGIERTTTTSTPPIEARIIAGRAAVEEYREAQASVTGSGHSELWGKLITELEKLGYREDAKTGKSPADVFFEESFLYNMKQIKPRITDKRDFLDKAKKRDKDRLINDMWR